MELNSRLNYIKEEDYPWMKDVTKHAAEHALVNLGKAFDNYLSGKSKYPNFHRKYRNDSFYLHHNDIKLNGKHIKIPKLGWVKMTEPLRFDGKINSATVSRTADKWFVSIAVEMRKRDILPRAVNEIGIDLGISALMTLSDGTKIDGVKPDKKLEASIRHSQRGLSRKQTAAKRQIGLAKSDPLPKGVHLPTSKNLEKNRLKLGKLHLHKANIRKDSLHKLTTNLTKNYTFIAIEDLNTAGMVKNHNLAKAIMNQGWGELKRQLEYKSQRTGTVLVTVDKWFASSKICSHCGHKNNDLKLSQRYWFCPCCHVYLDRDINAAINIKREGLANLNGSTAWPVGCKVCGEESSGSTQYCQLSEAKLTSSKQIAVE